MIRIESFYHVHEAQSLVDELERSQIPAFVNSERRGAAGALPFTQAYCEVWIDSDNDESRARQVLVSFRKPARNAHGSDRQCPSCKEDNPDNFGLCWKCGEPLSPQLQTLQADSVDPAGTTKRIVALGRSTRLRVAWSSAALIPAALFVVQGFEAIGLITSATVASLLWWTSGIKRANYCACCHAPLDHAPTRCHDCGKLLDGDLDERMHAKAGGKVASAGMSNAIAILFGIVIVVIACVGALLLAGAGASTRPSKPAAARSL